jgi:hypothetical protein
MKRAKKSRAPFGCRRALRAINAQLDGELSSAGAKKLCRHLEACEQCRLEKARLGSLAERLVEDGEGRPEGEVGGEAPAGEATRPGGAAPPESVWTRVRAEMERAQRGRGQRAGRGVLGEWSRAARLATMAAASVVGVLMGTFFYLDAFGWGTNESEVEESGLPAAGARDVVVRARRGSGGPERTEGGSRRFERGLQRTWTDPERTLVADAFGVRSAGIFSGGRRVWECDSGKGGRR